MQRGQFQIASRNTPFDGWKLRPRRADDRRWKDGLALLKRPPVLRRRGGLLVQLFRRVERPVRVS